MDKARKEEAFREIASKATQSSKRRFNDGEYHIEKAVSDAEIEEQECLNAAGEDYGFATEIALKANLIYDDFSKNERFNQEQTRDIQYEGKNIQCYAIGTREWKLSLAADNRDLKILNDPKEIKKLIEHNNPNDARNIIVTSESQNNPDYRSLKFDNEQGKISGHVLYPYYQLQNDKAKNLINTEYYCDVEDEKKYTIYALLTEDILKKENDGKTIMPLGMMENLVSAKEPAIILRYSSISGEDITSDELSFLRTFSHSVINANMHRFPLPKTYENFDFEKYDYQKFNHRGFRFFDNLDKMQKYYLQSCFTNEEINSMMNYISLLNQIKNNLDIELFLNNCIYFKDYVVNRMNINLTFKEKQFARIDSFCDLIKAFQPFDPNSKRLCDNEAFDTKEKIYYYKNEMQKKQKQKEKDSLSIINDAKFEILIEYIKETGKLPKYDTQYKEENIGAFLSNIRRGTTSISEEQKTRLLSLNSDVFENPRDIKKNHIFEILIEYIKETGKLPKYDTQYKEENIGAFLSNIRIGTTSITEEQRKRLLELKTEALDIKNNEAEPKTLISISKSKDIPIEEMHKIMGSPQVKMVISNYARGKEIPFNVKKVHLDNNQEIIVYRHRNDRIWVCNRSVTEEMKEKLKDRYKITNLDSVLTVGAYRRNDAEKGPEFFNKKLEEAKVDLENLTDIIQYEEEKPKVK